MFMGPFTQGGDWSDTGINGIARFVKKIFTFFNSAENYIEDAADAETIKLLHQTIKKVSADIDNLDFNTAISAMMILCNQITSNKSVNRDVAKSFLILLAPFAPHLSEEVWQNGYASAESIFTQSWPEYEEALTVENEVEIVIQINGKLRGRFAMPKTATKQEIEDTALANEAVKKYIEDSAQIKKTIIVPEKLVNFVI